jgi:3-deoxy-D-manno-octulosonate 8-phosphate phosphatase (KDO 8-P phosphatase)
MGRIKAVALDVDGVLTDGTFWWGPNGEEWKRFSFADVMGVSVARKSGLIVALVSGEDSPLVDRFAHKMGITDVFKNCKDKSAALRSLAERHRLAPGEICFMGDDINDLAAMEVAGMAASPVDAQPAALAKADLVTRRGGGNGAVREVIDVILSDRIVPRRRNKPARTR